MPKVYPFKAEQVIPNEENFLINVSSRNIDDVVSNWLMREELILASLFTGNREEQMSKIEALPVLRRWDQKDVQDGYNHSNFEEIVDGLPNGKYDLLPADTEEFSSSIQHMFFCIFCFRILRTSTYDIIEGKKCQLEIEYREDQ